MHWTSEAPAFIVKILTPETNANVDLERSVDSCIWTRFSLLIRPIECDHRQNNDSCRKCLVDADRRLKTYPRRVVKIPTMDKSLSTCSNLAGNLYWNDFRGLSTWSPRNKSYLIREQSMVWRAIWDARPSGAHTFCQQRLWGLKYKTRRRLRFHVMI